MRAWALLAVVLALTPARLFAQCPGFPARGVQVIDALYDGRLAWGGDDERRQLTKMVIEQLVYDFPNEGWTWKSADPGRPPSKDSIARIYQGRLCNWDWQNGATRERSVNVGDIGVDITGQNPIPVVGVNRMVSAPQQPQNPQPPQAPVGGAVTPDVIRAIVASEVDKVYAQNERIFANVSDNLLAILGREDLLAKQLEEHDQKVNKLVAFFSNGKTITALASFFSAYVALKQTQGQ